MGGRGFEHVEGRGDRRGGIGAGERRRCRVNRRPGGTAIGGKPVGGADGFGVHVHHAHPRTFGNEDRISWDHALALSIRLRAAAVVPML